MPSKIDPEPYFFRWKSVIVIKPRPGFSEEATHLPGAPFYQHRTCNGLVPVDATRIPPRVCPECGADCVKEAKEEEILKSNGAVMVGAEEHPAQLNRVTFPTLEPGTFDINNE